MKTRLNRCGKTIFTVFVSVALWMNIGGTLFLTGCIPYGPSPPAGWMARPVRQPESLFNDHPREGSLFQLLIGYKRFMGHSALRLVGPGDERLFWDPGGRYGEAGERQRQKDVIVGKDVPDIMDYAYFRYTAKPHLETEFTVMEWVIPDQTAASMRRVLVEGGDRKPSGDMPPERKFQTDVPAMFCAVAMSHFLMRYGRGGLTVSKSYAYPHDLVIDLWRNHPPRRVIAFKRTGGAILYLPRVTRPRIAHGTRRPMTRSDAAQQNQTKQ